MRLPPSSSTIIDNCQFGLVVRGRRFDVESQASTLLIDKMSTHTGRLVSLDVFRGLTIAGMILVNTAGLSDTYGWLKHADAGKGWTFADTVFPFFLYIIGVAMAFSLNKYITGMEKIDRSVYIKIIRRTVILFGLGLLLNGFWEYKLDTLRWLGVLQRIGMAYLIASIAILNLPRKGIAILAGVMLVGYWLLFAFFPAPDRPTDGVFSQLGNIGAYLDRILIPATHLYKGDGYKNLGDPEGLLGTIAATVNILFGYLTGAWLKRQEHNSRNSIRLLSCGMAALIIGIIWGQFFPIDKRLWTSSYAMLMTGWSLVGLAACYELVDVRRYNRWFKPFEILGSNAIVAFVASVLVIKLTMKNKIGDLSVYQVIKDKLFLWAGTNNSSVLFALLTVLFWMAFCYFLYRQRWFIRI
jgi:predicted acyltransferase